MPFMVKHVSLHYATKKLMYLQRIKNKENTY